MVIVKILYTQQKNTICFKLLLFKIKPIDLLKYTLSEVQKKHEQNAGNLKLY